MVRKGGVFGSFRSPAKKLDAYPLNRNIPVYAWTPKLSDRVQTPCGVGTVLEISGEMFLVDLENQVANVWERRSSIKRVS
jgi:hypothetical protein